VEEGTPPGEAAEEAGGEPSSFGGTAIPLVAALVLVGLGIAGWRYASTAPPLDRPDAALFTVATQPVELPTAAPVTGAGAADFLEGRRLLNAGDPAGAALRLAAAVAADPGNAEYHKSYGHALWRNGDREGALMEHAEAARLDPRLQMQYARSLDIAGHGAEAVVQYEELLAKNPAAATVHEDLGRLLFRNGEYAKAASHLQQAVQARPDDPVLAQELAYSLDQAGDRARATTMYRQVLAQAPQAVMARGLLAEALVQQGNQGEALSVLEEGLKTTPSAPLLHRNDSVLSGLPARGRRHRAYARLALNAPDARELAARAARLEAAGRRP
jgi:Flp pilus assembly protein TadD